MINIAGKTRVTHSWFTYVLSGQRHASLRQRDCKASFCITSWVCNSTVGTVRLQSSSL